MGVKESKQHFQLVTLEVKVESKIKKLNLKLWEKLGKFSDLKYLFICCVSYLEEEKLPLLFFLFEKEYFNSDYLKEGKFKLDEELIKLSEINSLLDLITFFVLIALCRVLKHKREKIPNYYSIQLILIEEINKLQNQGLNKYNLDNFWKENIENDLKIQHPINFNKNLEQESAVKEELTILLEQLTIEDYVENNYLIFLELLCELTDNAEVSSSIKNTFRMADDEVIDESEENEDNKDDNDKMEVMSEELNEKLTLKEKEDAISVNYY
jgi:hypothetical protein